MDIEAVGLALAERVATLREDLAAYGFNPDAPVVPAIFPAAWAVDLTAENGPVALAGGAGLYLFTLRGLFSRADDKSWQGVRDEVAQAVPGAIYAGAGDVPCSDLFVTAIRSPGTVEYGGIEFIGFEADVQVYG